MNSPILDDLGYLGVTPAAKEILNRTYVPPPGTDKYTVDYFKKLAWACPPEAQKGPSAMFSDYQISTEEHIDGWTKAKERTAPGHSDLTTAHWKASCTRPYLAALDASWANY
eukprot:scaffold2064_cov29-Attheya_sp.AAC.2